MGRIEKARKKKLSLKREKEKSFGNEKLNMKINFRLKSATAYL